MSNNISPFNPLNVGIIGCGNIFPAYAKGCSLFRKLNLKACADLNADAAKARAAESGIQALSIDELLANPGIDLVINLTVPKVHAKVSMDVLNAGKHVYSEKPLGVELAEGRRLMDLAREKGLRVGCAPDTFLGAGLQTSRKIIDDGWIGRPIGGTAFMLSAGPERWHPNPGFFYERGAGPMLDMGPYYVTALVHLLGPVRAISAVATAARSERLATCKEQFGRMLPVSVPTHYSGNLLFDNDLVITMAISFDVVKHRHSPIEIYGTEGSLSVPDPNSFGGPVSVFRPGNDDWKEVPLTHGYHENSRSIGAADMVHAISACRDHRCNGDLALHVLEVMTAFEESHARQAWVQVKNQCLQPKALPLGLPNGLLDD